ncbi:11537_t:CDS:1 [Ambispora leptoticha]|uniref:11537_t:CDS:1 n=1 Tax=Ambispora leptoticha TaxID=144679 RepID=A0A9N9GN51_9GLOM|nr:11537_t:CDS:1 [Ambispora leptoticha]
MNPNINQGFTDNHHNLLRYSYSVDEIISRLNELHQTEQQNSEPIDVWSNFIRGSDLPIVNENILLDTDRSFNSGIPTIEVESVESNLQPNPSTNNAMPQVENLSFTDNHHNLLLYFYSVDEVSTRLEALHNTEQQNNESIDIWSDFIRGSDLPVVNEEDVLLDFVRSFELVESDLQSNL